MKQASFISRLLFVFLLSACGPSPEEQATMTATSQTATAAAWTLTPTSTRTFTPTSTSTPTFTLTFTPTFTPTATSTPTITPSPTLTPTPTFNFPKVTVNKTLAACLFGPAKAYLWAYDLKAGDTGIVWGRAPVGNWLYVKMDRLNGPCWLSPYVVDVVGNVNTVIVETIRLWTTDALYAAPTNVETERRGDQVTVSWEPVWMTEDDDRGYFLDVWVCQDGAYVWMPVGLPNQYEDQYTFTDNEEGCSQPSGGQIYTVEKHGYTSPVDIPWPSNED